MAHATAERARDAEYMVVDVETTGLSPLHDRIIEVAVLRIRNQAVVDQFHTLINPGVSLPPDIIRLTGIRPADVMQAPLFADVAPALAKFLGQATLVAHNASFDYGFVREELRRAGIAYPCRTLCTMQLARRLIPQQRRYNLGAVVAALGISVEGKHRAFADVEATCQVFLSLLDRADPQQQLTKAAFLRLQRGSSHDAGANSLAAQARELPVAPGVYLFRNKTGEVVYAGKARQLRKRVQSHFRPGADEPYRLRQVLQSVVTVEGIETGSELEALLLESRLIKQFLPQGNTMQRDYAQYAYIRLSTSERFPRLSVTRELLTDGSEYFGPFRRASTAEMAIAQLKTHFRLPTCTGDIEPGKTLLCVYGQMARCMAPCVRRVDDVGYARAIAGVRSFLNGSSDLIALLDHQRDALADQLRFEEAAAIRDAADDLRPVFAMQRRLSFALDQSFVVAITASTEPGHLEVFAIRAGLLAAHLRLASTVTDEAALGEWLVAHYTFAPPTGGSFVHNHELDELAIVDQWLKRGREPRVVVAIEPNQPSLAAPAIAHAIAHFAELSSSADVGSVPAGEALVPSVH